MPIIVYKYIKMDINKELSVFNHIKYYDEPHIYYIDGEKTLSCTGFIHKFEEDFESNVDKPDKTKVNKIRRLQDCITLKNDCKGIDSIELISQSVEKPNGAP